VSTEGTEEEGKPRLTAEEAAWRDAQARRNRVAPPMLPGSVPVLDLGSVREGGLSGDRVRVRNDG